MNRRMRLHIEKWTVCKLRSKLSVKLWTNSQVSLFENIPRQFTTSLHEWMIIRNLMSEHALVDKDFFKYFNPVIPYYTHLFSSTSLTPKKANIQWFLRLLYQKGCVFSALESKVIFKAPDSTKWRTPICYLLLYNYTVCIVYHD